MVKYMNSRERGSLKPIKKNGETIKQDPAKTHIGNTKGIWRSNSFMPDILSVVPPLNDRSNTPRGALRAITLDRNFSKEKWLYNKNQLDGFDPEKSKRDLERSKTLKKISKRQQR